MDRHFPIGVSSLVALMSAHRVAAEHDGSATALQHELARLHAYLPTGNPDMLRQLLRPQISGRNMPHQTRPAPPQFRLEVVVNARTASGAVGAVRTDLIKAVRETLDADVVGESSVTE